MKVLIVVALCLLEAITIQGRPAKLEANNRGYNAAQSGPDEFLKITLEPIDQASAESGSEEEVAGNEAQDASQSHHVPILVDLREHHDDGSYSFRIEQGDGISRSESGSVQGQDGGLQAVGKYSFTHPDGTSHELTYVADQNGFQPSSDMLPTPFPLEPWHLEQIAFAESQKLNKAAKDEGSSEQSYEGAVDGVTFGLVADAGAEDVGHGSDGVGDVAFDVGTGSSGLAVFAGDAGVGDTGSSDIGAQHFGSSGSSGQAVFAGDVGVGDTGSSDIGAQHFGSSGSSGLAVFAGDAGVGDTGSSDIGAQHFGSSGQAVFAGDAGVGDSGASEIGTQHFGSSGLAVFVSDAGGAQEFGSPSSSGLAVFAGDSSTGDAATGDDSVITSTSAQTVLGGDAGTENTVVEDTAASSLTTLVGTQERLYSVPALAENSVVFPPALSTDHQTTDVSSASASAGDGSNE